MFFCLIFPVVSPVFLIYLIIKHLVDCWNLSRYYTALYDTPMLIKTSVQLIITSSLLPSFIIAIYHFSIVDYVDHPHDHDHDPDHNSHFVWSLVPVFTNLLTIALVKVMILLHLLLHPSSSSVFRVVLHLQKVYEVGEKKPYPEERVQGSFTIQTCSVYPFK